MRTLPGNLTYRNLHPLALHVATTTRAALPEAPCSINAHVDIAGLRVQVTGRGATAEEAVHHFKTTLAAMQPPTPAPVPKSREEQIAALLACGLRKAMQANDPHLVERLAKAAALVLGGRIEPGNRPGLLCVHSQTSTDLYYEIEDGKCTCRDAQLHPDRACKHRLAAAMYLRLIQ